MENVRMLRNTLFSAGIVFAFTACANASLASDPAAAGQMHAQTRNIMLAMTYAEKTEQCKRWVADKKNLDDQKDQADAYYRLKPTPERKDKADEISAKITSINKSMDDMACYKLL